MRCTLVGTRLVRLDLSTGAQQAWLTGTMSLQLAGADGLGHPLVELTSDSAGRPVDKPKLWLVTGPAQPVELRPPGGLGPPEIGPAGSVLEDGHGISGSRPRWRSSGYTGPQPGCSSCSGSTTASPATSPAAAPDPPRYRPRTTSLTTATANTGAGSLSRRLRRQR